MSLFCPLISCGRAKLKPDYTTIYDRGYFGVKIITESNESTTLEASHGPTDTQVLIERFANSRGQPIKGYWRGLHHPHALILLRCFADRQFYYFVRSAEIRETVSAHWNRCAVPLGRSRETLAKKVCWQVLHVVNCCRHNGYAHFHLNFDHIYLDGRGNAQLAGHLGMIAIDDDDGVRAWHIPTRCSPPEVLQERLSTKWREVEEIECWIMGSALLEALLDRRLYGPNFQPLEKRMSRKAVLDYIKCNHTDLKKVLDESDLSCTCKLFLSEMLDMDAFRRPNFVHAFNHPWFHAGSVPGSVSRSVPVCEESESEMRSSEEGQDRDVMKNMPDLHMTNMRWKYLSQEIPEADRMLVDSARCRQIDMSLGGDTSWREGEALVQGVSCARKVSLSDTVSSLQDQALQLPESRALVSHAWSHSHMHQLY